MSNHNQYQARSKQASNSTSLSQYQEETMFSSRKQQFRKLRDSFSSSSKTESHKKKVEEVNQLATECNSSKVSCCDNEENQSVTTGLLSLGKFIS